MSKRFQRTIEAFTCLHCGRDVAGTGYTNHCPDCLWARHVDVNPGDRLETCGGMMEPIRVELRRGAYVIVHRCERCGTERKNRTARDDDFETLVAIARRTAARELGDR